MHIRQIASKNYLIILYSGVILLLSYGLMKTSGSEHISKLIIHFISFVVSYLILRNFFADRIQSISHKLPPDKISDKVTYAFLIFIIGFILFHLVKLGRNPLIRAFETTDGVEAALVRQNLTSESELTVNYISQFLIKGLIPFFLMFLFFTNRKFLFYFFLTVSLFYAISLLQKNFCVTIFAPLLILLLVRRKWIMSALISFIVVGSVFTLIFASNPEMRGYKQKGVPPTAFTDNLGNGITGMINRSFVLPGKIVSAWFSLVPEKYPYLNGHGYHFLSVIPHYKYIDYSRVLYDDLYANYAQQGLKGTVNTASFVYDYSNFGIIGLILGGMIIACLFVFIESIFYQAALLSVVLNTLPVLMLSSGAIPTLMFSGGWGIMIVCFIFFRTRFYPASRTSILINKN